MRGCKQVGEKHSFVMLQQVQYVVIAVLYGRN